MAEQTVTEQGFRYAAGRLRQQLRTHSGRIRDMVRKDIQDIPGLMALLMKPRNGSRWTPAERAELVGQLRGISRLGLFLALAIVPGTAVALPLLAWWLDRRRTQVPRVADRRATDSPIGSRRGPRARDGAFADSPIGSKPLPVRPCTVALDSIPESRRGPRAGDDAIADSPIGTRRGPRARDGAFADSAQKKDIKVESAVTDQHR